MPSIISATTTNGLSTSADNSGSLQLATNNGTTAVTIDTSQNVGIGTTSPAAPADVVSNSNAIAVSMRGRVSDDACVIRWISNNGSTVNGRIQVNSGGDMIFQNTNSITERMRIDSSGRVLIGCTAVSGEVPTSSGISINQDGVQRIRVPGDGAYMLEFYNSSATQVGKIIVNGSDTAYSTTSDYRLKDNIAPITGALQAVQKLKPVTYTWKENGDKKQGFIAHELAEVCPDAVFGEKDAVRTVDDLDEDGKVIGTKEVPEYQGIDTSFLVATLTAAIQELNAKVEAQAVRIAELEGAK